MSETCCVQETSEHESRPGPAKHEGFSCCGTEMGDAMAECPCGPAMRHPVITSAILAVVGLAALLIPAGIAVAIVRSSKAKDAA